MDQSRRKYVRGPLEREHLDVDAIVQFQRWFEEACEHIDIEPNAMTLATVDSDGAPAARTVLLKLFDRDGFVFFTNLESRKAAHIENNHRVALLFWKLDEMKRKFANREVPLPSFWGGFRVVPSTIEFWQGQPDRLHDRFQYVREAEGWRIVRLAP